MRESLTETCISLYMRKTEDQVHQCTKPVGTQSCAWEEPRGMEVGDSGRGSDGHHNTMAKPSRNIVKSNYPSIKMTNSKDWVGL